jgi:adenosine deaminase
MSLPLIDLHRHLDGNVRLETILELGRKYNLQLPAWDLEGLRPHVQVTNPQPGVMAFIEKFKWMIAVLKEYETCRRIAYENVEDARKEGLAYVELRFSPVFMSSSGRLDPAGIVEAVCDGVAAGRRDFEQPVNLIGIISRTYGPVAAWKELEALLTRRDEFVALDLAGDEANYPAELFNEHFQRAREAGWQVTAHAGEIGGPGSIRQAIEGLGASRIGHAVSALADPDLLRMMKDKRIGIECNLTSNVQTSTVPDYPSHPLRRFLEIGLLATINTDDPGISGIDLAYELQVAAPAAGLDAGLIEQAKANALEISFLPENQKKAILTGAPFF